MILVKKEEGQCISCGGMDDLMSINAKTKASAYYGGIILCKKCRRKLINVLKDTVDEEE